MSTDRSASSFFDQLAVRVPLDVHFDRRALILISRTIDPMSDPHSSVSSLLESLLGDVDDKEQQCYSSSSLDYLLPLSWDFAQSDVSEEHGAAAMRNKRKREEDVSPLFQTPTTNREQRQRGKNWEKAEEDILVDCKRQQLDWKAVSECLQEHGFTRNHKHCADKWYALRKHYLEVHQWLVDHPGVDYWDRSCNADRIRSVPPSFCHKWYQIFDAAENRDGRKSSSTKLLQVPQKQRRKVESGEAIVSLNPHEGDVQELHELQYCGGDGAMEDETGLYTSMNSRFHVIEELVTEIQSLRRALTCKLAAEEKVRSRNLAIEEKKLELKRQRFDYQRRRDEEKRQISAGLQFAVKAGS